MTAGQHWTRASSDGFDRTVAHVSSFPPSPSGVALYAAVFDQVLAGFGPVERVVAPADPRESQSLRSALRGLVVGLGPRLREVDVVHVELSGRALYQFYVALGLTVGRRRSVLAITCHDAPSLVGWTLLFTGIDRRPFRRVALLASSGLGHRLENRLLSRCDVTVALTKEGAIALGRRAPTAVSLPHVVGRAPQLTKEPRVFVPGYVSDPDVVASIADVIARRATVDGLRWRIVVGSTDGHTRSEIERRLTPGGREVTDFAGHQSEEDLFAEFARAFIVVRPVGEARGNSLAASGPLGWAASRGCLCLTDDARSGARELADHALVIRSSSLPEDVSALLDRWPDHAGVLARAASAQALLGVEAVSERYGAVLQDADQRRVGESSAPV